jgi:hypothetical protein
MKQKNYDVVGYESKVSMKIREGRLVKGVKEKRRHCL